MHEAHARDAALVQSQLLAFLSEPARYRPHYLHGHEPLPEGSLVLRFAHAKFPHSLARDLSPERRERLREAAQAFIRQVCLWEGATHYQILCARPDARREAIKENYHLLMALIHPDRQDALAASWPADSAQRVNRAYNVLGDEQVRRDYDAGLRMMNAEIFTPDLTAGEPAIGARRGRRRRERLGLRFAKALLIFTAMAGTLLLLEVWVSDVSGHHSMFHGAFTGRDAAANGERPRYIAVDAWWRALRPSAEDPVAPAPSLPATIPSRAAPVAPPTEKQVAPIVPVTPPAPVALGELPAPALKRSESVDAVAAAPRKSAVVAQAAPPPASPPPGVPSAEAIEIMVARLVGHYEAGETDQLMALLDADESGYWQKLRMRQAYLDFFRATRQRKLRVNRLAWQTVDSSAHAKGEATVVAEYFDAPGMLERKVDLEMDIALRNGHAKITRLSLFPGAR